MPIRRRPHRDGRVGSSGPARRCGTARPLQRARRSPLRSAGPSAAARPARCRPLRRCFASQASRGESSRFAARVGHLQVVGRVGTALRSRHLVVEVVRGAGRDDLPAFAARGGQGGGEQAAGAFPLRGSEAGRGHCVATDLGDSSSNRSSADFGSKTSWSQSCGLGQIRPLQQSPRRRRGGRRRATRR